MVRFLRESISEDEVTDKVLVADVIQHQSHVTEKPSTLAARSRTIRSGKSGLFSSTSNLRMTGNSNESYPKPMRQMSSVRKRRKSIVRGSVFVDAEAMKHQIRESIIAKAQSSQDKYRETGCFQQVAKSHVFDLISLVMIFATAAWLFVDTDYNQNEVLSQAPIIFQLVEHVFCVYFLVELLIRLMAFKHKWEALCNKWWVFDLVLVLLMVIQTWLMPLVLAVSGGSHDRWFEEAGPLQLLRILRLTRMARVVRLMAAFPEMQIIIRGITMARKSVLCTLMLLVVIVYTFAVAFTLLTRGTDVGTHFFNRVPDSMNTLIWNGVLGENLPVVANALGAESIFLGGLLLTFVLLASLTVMNMLIGVLVEVVSVVARLEKETLVVNFVTARLQAVIRLIDPCFEGQITRQTFASMLSHPEALTALNEVGVDVVALVDLSDFIFERHDALCFSDFMEEVVQLRGSNTATVKHIVDLRKCLIQEFARFEILLCNRSSWATSVDTSGERSSRVTSMAAPGVGIPTASQAAEASFRTGALTALSIEAAGGNSRFTDLSEHEV